MVERELGLSLGDDERAGGSREAGLPAGAGDARVVEEDDGVARVEAQEIDVAEQRERGRGVDVGHANALYASKSSAFANGKPCACATGSYVTWPP